MLKRKRPDNGDDRVCWRNTPKTKFSRGDYTIGWIAALPIEMDAARAMLDEIHDTVGNRPGDCNTYLFGAIEAHNVVITCLPEYGTISAAVVASHMESSFPSLRYYLMVGIGGGVPTPNKNVDIRLGDIVVSKPTGVFPGVVQYDYGKTLAGGRFERVGTLNKPSRDLLAATAQVQRNRITNLVSEAGRRDPKNMIRFAHPGQDQDQLFQAEYDHNGEDTCDNCDKDRRVDRSSRETDEPVIHYGLIGSGNRVMKDGRTRDRISQQCGGIYCFEMEAAGLMDILPSIVIRGICDYSDSHKNKHWQGYAAATAAAYAKLLISVIPPIQILDTAYSDISLEETDDFEKTKLNCLRSLSFPNIDARQQNIATAHENTCDWFFQKPKFIQWKDRVNTNDHKGVLWIKGKPGAGKSTLMKHTFLYCKKSFLRHSIAAYFFHARGSQLEKSSFGMLRSLLYQILDQDADACRLFIPRFLDNKKKHKESWEWHPSELKDSLRQIVRHQHTHTPIILLVDALDECEEPEVRSVVRFLEDLSLDAIAAGNPLNICLSSRHYPTITMRKFLELVVERQTEHDEDITLYVRSKLSINNNDIVGRLLNKAQGVFMWVVLVTEMLNQAYEEGMLTAMRKRLEEIPSDLDEVFQIILEKDNQYKSETTLILQWVLFSHNQLRADELYYAVRAGTEIESLGPRKDTEETIQVISRFITTTSRGLVEITYGMSVQFIHETVNDFLIRNKRLQKLDPTLEPDVIGISHERLALCCLSYVEMSGPAFEEMLGAALYAKSADMQERYPLLKGRESTTMKKHYPFLEYASCDISYHAKNFGYNNGSTFLLRLQEPEMLRKFRIAHDAFQPSLIHAFGSDASLLYISVVWQDLSLIRTLLFESSVSIDIPGGDMIQALHQTAKRSKYVIRKQLRESVNLNAKGGHYGTALQAATVSGNKNIVELLLAAGTDTNTQGGHYGNALQGAAVNGYKDLVETLLAAGANINAQGGYYGTALQGAAVNGYKNIVETLLAAGADVNAQGGYYGTALQGAAVYRHKDTIEILLAAGADVNTLSGKDSNHSRISSGTLSQIF
ncbi:hypothetical protein TWF694_001340 [Orbilia ellipsospora]|uniref:Nephrocystin 3-like N-terminal domain-containing protein n=1 Tax=Orbilia ellipsospora TaxID=2528407 RepID=A0AAV9XRR8_9PEZI